MFLGPLLLQQFLVAVGLFAGTPNCSKKSKGHQQPLQKQQTKDQLALAMLQR